MCSYANDGLEQHSTEIISRSIISSASALFVMRNKVLKRKEYLKKSQKKWIQALPLLYFLESFSTSLNVLQFFNFKINSPPHAPEM